MNTRVAYVLYDRRNQLCNPTICFATYAYAYPIAQSIYVYLCAYYVYLGPYAASPARGVTERLLFQPSASI